MLSSPHTDSRPRVIVLRKEKSGFEKSPPLATNSVARARTLTNRRSMERLIMGQRTERSFEDG